MDVKIDYSNRKEFVLKALRLYDPETLSIESEASHCVLYTFDTGKSEWNRLRVEGPTFIVHRRLAPYYQLVVLNRLEHSNWVLDVGAIMNVSLQRPYLMIKHEHADGAQVMGLWTAIDADIRNLQDGVMQAMKAGREVQPAPVPGGMTPHVTGSPLRDVSTRSLRHATGEDRPSTMPILLSPSDLLKN